MTKHFTGLSAPGPSVTDRATAARAACRYPDAQAAAQIRPGRSATDSAGEHYSATPVRTMTRGSV
ncbi:hypothetical protein DKT69_05555 [Micromonospora sicca]|uniref:Uncharacterized protein n=1 Tax=Micromonospora sicca TaxID=2202420 RepID=A0A317DP74_9ACTN|nr:hypothetical protein DKT69_05555 [Micromonospora sp. 4G51]